MRRQRTGSTTRAPAAAVIVAALALCAVGDGHAGMLDPVVYTEYEQQMLVRVNDLRASVGAGPVVLQDNLTRVARRYARYMKENDHFDHPSLDGTTAGDRIKGRRYRWSTYGENLAARSSTISSSSVDAMYVQWETSPGHSNNMVNASFTEVGIGFYDGDGAPGSYGMYGVQNFGARLYGDFGTGEVEIDTPTDGDTLPTGESTEARWTVSPWVDSVEVRVSTNGGMEWTTLTSSTVVDRLAFDLPVDETEEFILFVGATPDVVNDHWYFDAAVGVAVLYRPEWVELTPIDGGQALRLQWTSVADRPYAVDIAATMAGPWVQADEVVGGDGATEWSSPPSAAQRRFYRVRPVPR